MCLCVSVIFGVADYASAQRDRNIVVIRIDYHSIELTKFNRDSGIVKFPIN